MRLPRFQLSIVLFFSLFFSLSTSSSCGDEGNSCSSSSLSHIFSRSLQQAGRAYEARSLEIEDEDEEEMSRMTQCELNGVEIPFAALEKFEMSSSSSSSIRGGGMPNLLRSVATRIELGNLLNDMQLTGVAAEVGVFRGDFSRRFLQVWQGRKLLMIDAWTHIDGYRHDRNEDMILAEQNVAADFPGRYEFVQGLSHQVVHQYEDKSLDFVYIDASHTYAMTRRDIGVWYPKVKQGGIMAGHDYFNGVVTMHGYLPTAFGVKDAVDEFAAVKRIRVYQTRGGQEEVEASSMPSWYFIKCE